jgi:C-terminal processing protease CtpA/Prc
MPLAFGQLTIDQKTADFGALANLYTKRYGPYEWKRDALHFDLMEVAPWLSKVQATKDDLDFYEVLSEYVASLNDAHASYLVPSTFVARLNFGVDLYGDKLLVDTINRQRLPANEFGFQTGYELVSIDGVDAQRILDGLLRYGAAGNPRSTRRYATLLLTTRSQGVMPHATAVPEISTVTFRRPDGATEQHRIPWTKTGLPLASVGRYQTPLANAARPMPGRRRNPDGPNPGGPAADIDPPYMGLLRELQNCNLPDRGFLGFGALAPVFAPSLPAGFILRLGRLTSDPFYSGVFEVDGFKIGYIRIPSFQPVDSLTALTLFRTEITFFQANTNGLVVDLMRDFGGSSGYANQILNYLMPEQWRSIPFEMRATSELAVSISTALTQAQALSAPKEVIDLFQSIKDAVLAANHQSRGRTAPIPLDDSNIEREPLLDSRGAKLAYTKPLILLVDEMTASAAELVAATIQDNRRGPLIGWRTMGAGGTVETREAGTYSLGAASVTRGLMIRKENIATSEYPTAPYIENIGVRPDIPIDYMTRENLLQNGRPFVDAWVSAIVAEIGKGK